jgi:hypothetical protein
VAPFIRNKISKNVVDYCLLEDEQAIAYSDSAKYRNLNAFEKALLVWVLVKKDKR